jgi:transducin (beta)-like 1
VDKTTIVWDASTGAAGQQFSFHTDAVLDVDWVSDSTFASCSSDKTVVVCSLGERAPVRSFTGHTDEVNAIQWSPDKSTLASCSDDGTARLWSLGGSGGGTADKGGCVAVLSGHTKPIYSVKWAPTGPASSHPDRSVMLAT